MQANKNVAKNAELETVRTDFVRYKLFLDSEHLKSSDRNFYKHKSKLKLLRRENAVKKSLVSAAGEGKDGVK